MARPAGPAVPLVLGFFTLMGACVDLGRPPIPVDVVDAPVAVDAAVDRRPEVPEEDVNRGPGAEVLPPPPPDAANDAPVVKENGEVCSDRSQCASGLCVDGVCCNTGCAGLCESCASAGALGTCSPVGAGTDPASECSEEASSGCGRDGFCDGARGCRLRVAGTACAVGGSCANGVETATGSCDGRGSCGAGMTRDCSPYLCSGNRCGTTCTTPSNCDPGASCIGAACTLAAGLQLYWNFDEASGTVAIDQSGNGRDGTLSGSVGSSGPAVSTTVPTLKFPNPTSRLFHEPSRTAARLPSLPTSMTPANNITLSLWFRAPMPPVGQPHEEWFMHVSGGYGLYSNFRDGVGFWKRTTNRPDYDYVYLSTNKLFDGNWHHIAGVSTPGSLQVYVDGQVKQLMSSSAVVYDSTRELTVGTATTRNFLSGHLDEIRYYHRALSAAEIADLASGGR